MNGAPQGRKSPEQRWCGFDLGPPHVHELAPRALYPGGVRVLVTNDDGVRAPGIRALALALVSAGHDVSVIAPAHDCSGFGAALGPLHITGKIDFERVTLDDLDAPVCAVEGPPALCVFAACLGGFGDTPELVVSGINLGANTGRAILHSGTVGAALTGLNFGCPGLAVSQVAGEPQHWDAAAAIAVAVASRVTAWPADVVLNLNVPNASLDRIAGVVPAILEGGGTVRSALIEREAGVLEWHLPERPAPGPGTDNHWLAQGFATITPLHGPRAASLAVDELASEVSGALPKLSDRLSA
jgi:5'-nucleotidase